MVRAILVVMAMVSPIWAQDLFVEVDPRGVAFVESSNVLVLRTQSQFTPQSLAKWVNGTYYPGQDLTFSDRDDRGQPCVESRLFMPGVSLPNGEDIEMRLTYRGVCYEVRISRYGWDIPFHFPDGDAGGVYLFVKVSHSFGNPIRLHRGNTLLVQVLADHRRGHIYFVVPLRVAERRVSGRKVRGRWY